MIARIERKWLQMTEEHAVNSFIWELVETYKSMTCKTSCGNRDNTK